MLGRTISPTPNALLAGYFFHDDAKKVAPILALGQHSLSDPTGIETGHPEEFAVHPCIHELFFVFSDAQVAESWFQQIDGVGFRPVHGEIPGGKNHVIKQSRTGPTAAQDKYGRYVSRISPSFCGFLSSYLPDLHLLSPCQ